MTFAFLTESEFTGKVSKNFQNMRTEMAWQSVLQSDHFNIHHYESVKNYDVVFVIFPKCLVKLNAIGIEMFYNNPRDNHNVTIYSKPIIETLKNNNKIVCNIQEGPSWFFNEYDVLTQFNFYNQLSNCDILFSHNEYDVSFYKGMFPHSKTKVIPSLMIINEEIQSYTSHEKQNKAIIGGNFCHWYGGFQSYITSTEFDCPIFVPSSHCKQQNEEHIPNLTHLSWVMWNDWMKQLSTFKYSVNLMPTVAAGTFSMNCAYFGIPCIGNENVDTQKNLFPELCVDVNDVYKAKLLASRLKNDVDFYEKVSTYAKNKILTSPYADIKMWENLMFSNFNEI